MTKLKKKHYYRVLRGEEPGNYMQDPGYGPGSILQYFGASKNRYEFFNPNGGYVYYLNPEDVELVPLRELNKQQIYQICKFNGNKIFWKTIQEFMNNDPSHGLNINNCTWGDAEKAYYKRYPTHNHAMQMYAKVYDVAVPITCLLINKDGWKREVEVETKQEIINYIQYMPRDIAQVLSSDENLDFVNYWYFKNTGEVDKEGRFIFEEIKEK